MPTLSNLHKRAKNIASSASEVVSDGVDTTVQETTKRVDIVTKDPASIDGVLNIFILILMLLVFLLVLYIGYKGVVIVGGGVADVIDKIGGDSDPGIGKPGDPKTVEVVVFYGQSLAVGVNGKPILSNTQENPENVLSLSGGPGGSQLPLQPCTEKIRSKEGETPGSAMANVYFRKYMKGQANRVVIAGAFGVGSQAIKDLKPGTMNYERSKTRIELIMKGAKEKFPNAKSVRQAAMCWLQGERDWKTNTSPDDYKRMFKTMTDDMNKVAIASSSLAADDPNNAPIAILSYQTSYGSSDGSVIPQTQLDMHNEKLLNMVSPIYFLPLVDGIHFTNRGSGIMGAYFARGLDAVRRGKRPPLITPHGISASGNKVIVKFSVPSPPLQAATYRSVQNHGFTISGATITSVDIGKNEVTLNTSGPVSQGAIVSYAMSGSGKIGHGTLMDSCKDKVNISAGGVDEVVLSNYCPHFNMAI